MAEPFLAEIRLISFHFPPKGWAFCNGQLLPINQNQALFALLGTTYGGNGQTTFALPDLRGRTPVHVGRGVSLGQAAGTEFVTLAEAQLPKHGHLRATKNIAAGAAPAGNMLAQRATGTAAVYAKPLNQVVMPGAIPQGGGQAHSNIQPSMGLNFVIALQGIFPSKT